MDYTPNGSVVGKGGLATILNAKWGKFVNASGTVLNNRGFWFILSGIPRGETRFINIYAPNEPFHRYVLWKILMRDLPCHCEWV